MISKEQGIIVFLGLPVLFFIAFLILVFSAHRRERRNFSFLRNPLYESFADINPTLLYVARILFILYIVSTIPFYTYLTYFASQYNLIYLSLTIFIMALALVNGVATFFTSFIKLSVPKKHILSFVVMMMSSILLSVFMAHFFNITREMHVFSIELDNSLFATTLISLVPMIIGAVIVANKRLQKWEFFDKEKDKVYYLAFAEWASVFITLLSLIISVLGFFLIQ